MSRLLMIASIVLAASLVGAQERCAWGAPPPWPSFCYTALENGHPWHLFEGEEPPPDGVIVLGWLGTSMPGPEPVRVWVYVKPDGSRPHSRTLHAEALERLYAEVEAWLKAQKDKP